MTRMAFYDTAQLDKLQKAIESKDWFTAIVISAIQLERHGYLRMNEYFEKIGLKSQIIKKLMHNQNMRAIGGFLLLSEQINGEELATMLNINTERNKFVHRSEKGKSKHGREAQKQYKPLVEEAIRILIEKLSARRLFIGR